MLSNLGLLCSLATCCLAIKQHSVSWALPIKKQLLYSCMFMSGAGQLALHAKLCTLIVHATPLLAQLDIKGRVGLAWSTGPMYFHVTFKFLWPSCIQADASNETCSGVQSDDHSVV